MRKIRIIEQISLDGVADRQSIRCLMWHPACYGAWSSRVEHSASTIPPCNSGQGRRDRLLRHGRRSDVGQPRTVNPLRRRLSASQGEAVKAARYEGWRTCVRSRSFKSPIWSWSALTLLVKP